MASIYEGLLYKSNLKIDSKVYILQEYMTTLKTQLKDQLRQEEGSSESLLATYRSTCYRLLESCLKELPYSRLILGMYIDFLREEEPYKVALQKAVRAFEGALERALQVGERELNLTLHLYHSTIHGLCKSMGLIFKIEKK